MYVCVYIYTYTYIYICILQIIKNKYKSKISQLIKMNINSQVFIWSIVVVENVLLRC